MKLVITEKPSVAMSIAKVLGASQRNNGYYQGNNYLVSWCVGHLVELAYADEYNENLKFWKYKDLPILPTEWQYTIKPRTKKQYDILQKLLCDNRVDTVICATDAGREGELIFRLVYNMAQCNKPIQRLWISSLEDKAIKDGFENMKNGVEYNNLYQAALARSKADWLVGINATRLFSILYGETLNIGRVMSPTLAMIVQRNKVVSDFVSEPFYNANLIAENNVTFNSRRFKDKNEAENLLNECKNQALVIEDVEKKAKFIKPPALYDLTTLQREANRKFGFTASQTLEFTQSLYEKKLCTYPRTDSRFLSEDMERTVAPLIKLSMQAMGMMATEPTNIALVINSSKVTDHHAIIPTQAIEKCDIASLSFGEKSILNLIMARLLCAVGDTHKYSDIKITASCADNIFTAKGKTIIQNGFKDFELQVDNERKKSKSQSLPLMAEGELLDILNYELKIGKTSPPNQYTDDTLLSAMENANNAEVGADMKGIGTPATRAGVMEKLINTGLVQRIGDKKAKKFIPTEKGIALSAVLPEAIKSPLLTARWEEKLKEIEQGKLSANVFLNEINQMLVSLVNDYEVVDNADILFPKPPTGKSLGACTRCGSDVTENHKGFCCSNRTCDFAIWKANKFFSAKKKVITKELVSELLSKGKVRLDNCYSAKTGKTYNCMVMIDDDGGDFVGFRVEFLRKGKKF